MDVDERIKQEIDRLAKERDAQHLYDGVTRIRRHRAGVRRLGSAALAVVVLAGSAAGFMVLSHAFGKGEPTGVGAGTPGNGLIAYSDLNTATGDGDIFVMQSDGSNVTALPHPGVDYDPTWSPDGTQIFFAKDGLSEDQQGIFVMDADGSDVRRISDTSSSSFSLSPDGSTIAYQDWLPGVSPTVGETTDTGSFAFVDGERVTPSIWLMGADGSDPRTVPGTEGANDGKVAWSPDGSLLAFSKGSAIWLVGVDGSDPHLLADDGWSPLWSPDGATILFVSERHSVESISPDGTGRQVLAHDGSSEYSDLAYAPDGTRILVTAAPDVSGPQNYEIYSMDPDGANVEQLTNIGSDPEGWCCLDPSWQATSSGNRATA
jgi:Tol biopolymer transport system component